MSIKVKNNICPQRPTERPIRRDDPQARRNWLERFLYRMNKEHAPNLRRLARGE